MKTETETYYIRGKVNANKTAKSFSAVGADVEIRYSQPKQSFVITVQWSLQQPL